MSLPTTQRAAFLLGPERLELREVPVGPPGPGELLLQVGAALTCGTDVKVFRRGGHPSMLEVPGRFGHEMAGTVEAVGAGVTRWRAGDLVAVANSSPCDRCPACARGEENLCLDLQYLNGAFAEYLLVPRRFAERSVYALAPGIAFEIAALAEPLACVLHGLEVLALKPRSDVLVLGAGPIGLLFVLALGPAGHRAALADPHQSRLSVGSTLGAEAVVAVERGKLNSEELRRSAMSAAGFDAVIDASGDPSAWRAAAGAIRPGGSVCLFAGPPAVTVGEIDLHHLHYREQAIRGAYHYRPSDYARALERLSAPGAPARALLSAERPLAQLEEALRSMMRRETLKVVIRP